MAKKYLDYDGLLYFWQKLKTTFAKTVDVPTKTSDLTNDSGYITSASIPSATTTTPKMDGTASVGSETKWAKGDHVHPSDTSRVPTTRKVNGKALSADVILYAGDVAVSSSDDTTVASALSNKVDKVEGKGLSTNDYTDAEKTKLGKLVFDGSDKIDSSILPSYVDDVIEAYPVSGATELSAGWLSKTSGGSALTPEAGVIYVLMSDTTNYSENSQFRWATNTYVKLADGGVSSITNGEIDTIIAS